MSIRTLLMIISLALSVLIGLVISRSGSTGATSGSEKPIIALSMDTLKEARWLVDRDLIVKRCAELGARVEYLSASGDDAQQVRDVESLLTFKPKALIIIPHDGKVMAKGVEMAQREGVPVIAYDRLIRDSDVDLYVGFDSIKVGELQARYLVDHLPTPGRGRIVRVYGSPTDNNAKLFKQGQDNVILPLVESGAIEVVHEDWAEDWRPDNAKKIVNAAITKVERNFDGVLASNDGTAGGAVQALTEEGLAGKIPVTGQDAELAACQRIASGTQAMTVYKPIKVLATGAAEAAVKLATGKPIIANTSLPNGKIDVPTVVKDVVLVTKANLVDTVVKDGFQSYDDVYRSVPEDQSPPK